MERTLVQLGSLMNLSIFLVPPFRELLTSYAIPIFRSSDICFLSGKEDCAPKDVVASAPAAFPHRQAVPKSCPSAIAVEKAPIKASPAPVESTTFTECAGRLISRSAVSKIQPFPPRVNTICCAPIPSKTFKPDRISLQRERVTSSVSFRMSVSTSFKMDVSA
jgi:hypothetical protein